MFSKLLTDQEDELQRRERKLPVHLSFCECWSLHRFLEHGSKEHRIWLAEAITAWSLGKPKPEERN